MEDAELKRAYEEERNLHQLLRDREDELGITVTEAAKRAELPLRQYQKYRNEDVIPQGPTRKRLRRGLGLPAPALRNAIEMTEAEREMDEQRAKGLESPASREDVQRLEAKLSDIEKQLREIRAVLIGEKEEVAPVPRDWDALALANKIRETRALEDELRRRLRAVKAGADDALARADDALKPTDAPVSADEDT